MLLEYFIKRYASRVGKNIKNVDKGTVELFQSYDWPGNIRELQNVIERSVILCEGEAFRLTRAGCRGNHSSRIHHRALLPES